MVKFLHAADVHLDSPLRGLQRYEGAPVAEIRHAARRAFERLVELALAERVDFVLLAGDLYDGDWPDYNTGLYFVRQAAKLREAGIPLLAVAGNHDAASRLTHSLRLPDNVTLFSPDSPHSQLLESLGVAVHGQSFARPETVENLAVGYPAAVPGLFNIGLLHTCATGREGHDRYAPCSLDDLRSKGYDYWALGHVHQRETLCEQPFVAFPGNIQGRHVREAGAKGCLLVQVDEGRAVAAVDFRPLDVMRWVVLEETVDTCRDVDQVLDGVSAALDQLRRQAAEMPHAVRVVLRGETPLHGPLHAAGPHLAQQLRSLAIDVGGGAFWIERVQLETRDTERHGARGAGAGGGTLGSGTLRSGTLGAGTLGAGTLGAGELADDGALGELRALFAELAVDPRTLESLGCGWDDVARRLPAELQSLLPRDDPQWLRELLRDAESRLLGRLWGSELAS